MKSIDDLANELTKTGDVPNPKLVTVETQVRTGLMFPLPDWIGSSEDVVDAEPGKK